VGVADSSPWPTTAVAAGTLAQALLRALPASAPHDPPYLLEVDHASLERTRHRLLHTPHCPGCPQAYARRPAPTRCPRPVRRDRVPTTTTPSATVSTNWRPGRRPGRTAAAVRRRAGRDGRATAGQPLPHLVRAAHHLEVLPPGARPDLPRHRLPHADPLPDRHGPRAGRLPRGRRRLRAERPLPRRVPRPSDPRRRSNARAAGPGPAPGVRTAPPPGRATWAPVSRAGVHGPRGCPAVPGRGVRASPSPACRRPPRVRETAGAWHSPRPAPAFTPKTVGALHVAFVGVPMRTLRAIGRHQGPRSTTWRTATRRTA
jgi:hypothetical protein